MGNNKSNKTKLKTYQRHLQKVKNTRVFLSKFAGGEEVKNTEREGTMQITLIQAINLLSGYKDKKFITELRTITTINKTNPIDFVDSMFAMVEEELNILIDLIEEKIEPQLSINERETLSGFREDLKKITIIGIKDSVERNLEEAIGELEDSHILACGMISARTTLYVYQKIKSKEDSEESKVEALEKLGVIKKGEISKQTSKSFLESVKSARNFILHDKDYFPDYSEASGYLSSAIKIVKIYQKYLKIVE